MSDTPRTDELIARVERLPCKEKHDAIAELCRQLERELASKDKES